LSKFNKKYNQMLRLPVILFFTLFSLVLIKAQVTVGGIVTDVSTGEKLIGVTVIELGSANGTVTDDNGQYSISLISDTSLLQFYYVGFTTQSIKVIDKLVINVAMKSNELLDEAIVIGYGEQSKSKITSAVSTIDAKTLKKLPIPIVSNGLEGLASGLFVRQGSGEPGFSGSSFEIRNFGNALVIVDGSPGNIDDLDPNEIENISILKDAAAAAVYGVQGGNGVILVTTRKGTIGKPELNYSNQLTQNSFTQYPDFLNSVDYANVLNEGLVNDGKSPFYTNDEIEAFRSGSV
jgi:TonB-dependent SusC/RagA subfamily outer membrane receptor